MTSPSTAGDAVPSGQRAGAAAGRAPAILASKLAPPGPARATTARPRLLEALTQHVQRCPVTLLSGPAGSGKSTLAAGWWLARTTKQPMAWLSLDEYDDDPATFWSYLIEALSAAGVHLSEVPDLVAGEPPPGWLITRLAAEVASCPRPVVLVLDNADVVTDRSVMAGLDVLVRNTGQRLRLVMCGRADPLLPLHRYRLDGSLGEIRTDELAFTPEETSDLLAALGAPVTPEVSATLCAETQGWAVGLRLAVAPLTQGVPPEQLFTALARDDGSVAQYLFAEVLEGQPAGVRRVLLRTSVTEELWPELVDRLAGRRNARRVLAALVKANAFVEASPSFPGGFRIHPLFRDMLEAQLAYEHPGEIAGLHRTCAEWYVETGRPVVALSHAVTARDWDFVARLYIENLWVPRVLAHGTDALAGPLRSVPPELRGPEAAVVRTVAAVTGGRAAAAPDLEAARRALVEGDRLELRISAGLAFLAASGSTEIDPAPFLAEVDAVAALVARLPEEQEQARRESAAVLSGLRAFAALRTDAPTDQLVAGLRSAAATAQTAGARRLRARAVGNLALLEALEGHLTRAAGHASEAEAFAVEEGADEAHRDPAPALARSWVHLRRYMLVEAQEDLATAREREASGGSGAPGVDALHAVLQGQQYRLRHDYDSAESLLRPQLRAPHPPRWAAEPVVTEMVRLHVARGHVEEALTMLSDGGHDEPATQRLRATVGLLSGRPTADLAAPAPGVSSLADQVESSVVRACQLLERGRASAAVDEVVVALDLARPELLRWPFIDTPPQARRLLRTHPRLQEPSSWLNPSSGVQPRPVPVSAPAASEELQVLQDLSEREMQVLRHLAEMLSTAEIAATMFISVNTVRTHIRSILRKLSVSRRNQAVRKARQRGLL